MKKIMFNDRFGLTQAVLDGRKTMTRRIVQIDERPCKEKSCIYCSHYNRGFGCKWINDRALYKFGEVVAVAQSYENVISPLDWISRLIYKDEPGWTNKMFVKAECMPHRIRITGIKAERLQDISDEDCRREGIIRQSVIEYGDKKIVQWTYFREKITKWYDSPREAFAALIDRITGKGTWERNPWVFAYEFELIKD